MGIWINRGKQQFLAVLCLHFATSLINSILCAAACLCCCPALLCSALLCLGLSFIQRCGRGWPQSQWHFGKAQQYRVQSGECLREHSWGGSVPSCQMLVKNTHVIQPVGETNVWTLRQMYDVLWINMRYCFCPEQSLLITPSIINNSAVNVGWIQL